MAGRLGHTMLVCSRVTLEAREAWAARAGFAALTPAAGPWPGTLEIVAEAAEPRHPRR
jgi:hypothetical protein